MCVLDGDYIPAYNYCQLRQKTPNNWRGNLVFKVCVANFKIDFILH